MRLSFLLCLLSVITVEGFRKSFVRRPAITGAREALAKHVIDRLEVIKERYIELTGLLAATDVDEDRKLIYQEEKRGIQTVVESYNALDEINRDIQTFLGVLADPDKKKERSDAKDVAKVFLKEFDECRAVIESQLTSYVERTEASVVETNRTPSN